ncbi:MULTISPECIES: hypothetical protein [unclassified Virgibacillus]|uniref:hypothetical protein n=1 Tax=unclassified Virgibacillus TaxID=2620237 RepID=UPI00090A1315|nr:MULTISPECIES: hypothetical protein [unclassified Virgibacillus]API92693.1 hypothetical protein BKP57_13290 [Virgibacillus sp. 6R]MBS7428188.1 hypothetical protein [Virgibacillus sp. 19R1-5]
MTELELYEFIKNNRIEIDWRGNALLIWLEAWALEDFCNLLNRDDSDDGGLDCQLQNGGDVVLDLVKVCKEWNIDPNNILEGEE